MAYLGPVKLPHEDMLPPGIVMGFGHLHTPTQVVQIAKESVKSRQNHVVQRT